MGLHEFFFGYGESEIREVDTKLEKVTQTLLGNDNELRAAINELKPTIQSLIENDKELFSKWKQLLEDNREWYEKIKQLQDQFSDHLLKCDAEKLSASSEKVAEIAEGAEKLGDAVSTEFSEQALSLSSDMTGSADMALVVLVVSVVVITAFIAFCVYQDAKLKGEEKQNSYPDTDITSVGDISRTDSTANLLHVK